MSQLNSAVDVPIGRLCAGDWMLEPDERRMVSAWLTMLTMSYEHHDIETMATAFADVCRRHDVSSGLIYTWRRKLLDAGVAQEASPPEALPTPVFVEAMMDVDPAAAASSAERPAMIIDLPRGKRLSVFAAASPALVAAALKGLR